MVVFGYAERDGAYFYNSAAVFQRGAVVGLYRKLHPAIRRSIYEAGHATPVFTVGALTFGIIICRDSTFPEPARAMASRGAVALFVPTNNGLPPAKASPSIIDDARNCDITLAIENGMSVIRADVAGQTPDLLAYGSSGVVDQDGVVLKSAQRLQSDLVVAEIATTPRARRAIVTVSALGE